MVADVSITLGIKGDQVILKSLQGIDTGFNEAEKEAKEFGAASAKAGNNASKSLNKAGESATKLTGIFKALASAVVVNEFIEANRAMENVAISFNAIFKEAGQAEEELRIVRDESDRLGLHFLETAKSFRGFASAMEAAGQDSDLTREIFFTTAGAMQKMGASADDLKELMRQLGQAAGGSALQAEEFNIIADRLPGIIGAVQKEFELVNGKVFESQKAFKDAIGQGYAPAIDILKLFPPALEKMFSVSDTERVETYNAQVGRLKTAWDDLLVALGKTGLFDALASAVKVAGQALNVMTVGVMTIAGEFTSWTSGIGAAWTALKELRITDIANDFKNEYNVAVNEASVRIADFVDKIKGGAPVLNDFNEKTVDSAKSMDTVRLESEKASQKISLIDGVFINASSSAEKLGTQIIRVGNSFSDGKDPVEAFRGTISEVIDESAKAEESIKNVADSMNKVSENSEKAAKSTDNVSKALSNVSEKEVERKDSSKITSDSVVADKKKEKEATHEVTEEIKQWGASSRGIAVNIAALFNSLTEQMKDYSDATHNLFIEYLGWGEQIDTTKTKTDEFTDAMNASGRAVTELRHRLIELTAKGAIWGQISVEMKIASERAKAAFFGQAAAAEELTQKLRGLEFSGEATLHAAELTVRQFDLLDQATLDAITGEVNRLRAATQALDDSIASTLENLRIEYAQIVGDLGQVEILEFERRLSELQNMLAKATTAEQKRQLREAIDILEQIHGIRMDHLEEEQDSTEKLTAKIAGGVSTMKEFSGHAWEAFYAMEGWAAIDFRNLLEALGFINSEAEKIEEATS